MDVHGKGAFQQGAGDALEADAERLNAGVVDENIHTAELPLRGVEHDRDIFFAGDISFTVKLEIVGRWVPVGDEHARAGVTKAPRDGAADAGGASGDDGGFVGE